MKDISVAVATHTYETRLLATDPDGDMMIARLGPLSQAQPGSVRLMLEALALWHRTQLRVVVCADCERQLESVGLTDGFGFGVDTLHYAVKVLDRDLHELENAIIDYRAHVEDALDAEYAGEDYF